MKRIIPLIKNKIDWVMIIAGLYLFSFNLLGFDDFCAGTKFTPRFSNGPCYVAYYYPINVRINVAIGAALVVWGILLYKSKKLK